MRLGPDHERFGHCEKDLGLNLEQGRTTDTSEKGLSQSDLHFRQVSLVSVERRTGKDGYFVSHTVSVITTRLCGSVVAQKQPEAIFKLMAVAMFQ